MVAVVGVRMTVNLSPGDTSTAKNIPDFIAALRRAWTVYDPAQVTNPECATVKIQYESIRDDRMSIADDLERFLEAERLEPTP